jgi:AraC family transcriptional regulator, regulatory protein of adaptative response / methylated-DNA-[protein]-cysteine methyltransferase
MSERILFSTAHCALGVALVATSEQGVCALLLGNAPGELARDLRQRFPQAELKDAAAELDPVVSKVTGFLAQPRAALDLALDLRGTPLERRVWDELQTIPAGSTQTYGEIAERIGATAKEVGEACAANPVAVAIPCHRVVRKDGSLAGYRWGFWRKRALLRREAA